jgi:hypothetical protein
MSTYDESRAPRKIHGPTKTSLISHSNNCSEVNASVFNLYVIAAKSVYMEGEPENLTSARNELLSARRVVINFHNIGIPPIFAPHIDYALRVSGWLK